MVYAAWSKTALHLSTISQEVAMVLVSQRTSTIRRGSVQTVLTRFNNVNSLLISVLTQNHEQMLAIN